MTWARHNLGADKCNPILTVYSGEVFAMFMWFWVFFYIWDTGILLNFLILLRSLTHCARLICLLSFASGYRSRLTYFYELDMNYDIVAHDVKTDSYIDKEMNRDDKNIDRR